MKLLEASFSATDARFRVPRQNIVQGGLPMTKKLFEQAMNAPLSRRHLLQGSAGLLGGTMLSGGLILPAAAADQPPIGTWPAGSQGNTVFIGATVPRTGTYAVQGEDELKGYQLAIEPVSYTHLRAH